MAFLYHKLSENFRGIFLEKYHYFSGNFQKNSAGNFPTYNPTGRMFFLGHNLGVQSSWYTKTLKKTFKNQAPSHVSG